MSRLENLGEEGLISELSSWLKFKNPHVKVSIGDDALVLDDGTVVSSDSYEEEIHFSSRYFTPEDIGYKCAGATISDIAAMGAEPLCILVNLFAPGDLEVAFVKRLYKGIEEIAASMGCEIAGGDTVRSSKLILSCTVVGKAEASLLRSGASSGDGIYVSGFPGLSVVGQRVLSVRKRVQDFKQSRKRHLRPEPRVGLGLALQGKATSCMDVSDGVSTDAGRLARSSGIKLILEHENLPKHPEIARYINQYGGHWDSLVLNGGEDYELLFTSSSGVPSEIADIPIHRIGRIEEGEGAFLEIDGELKSLEPRGWDHFR